MVQQELLYLCGSGIIEVLVKNTNSSLQNQSNHKPLIYIILSCNL